MFCALPSFLVCFETGTSGCIRKSLNFQRLESDLLLSEHQSFESLSTGEVLRRNFLRGSCAAQAYFLCAYIIGHFEKLLSRIGASILLIFGLLVFLLLIYSSIL